MGRLERARASPSWARRTLAGLGLRGLAPAGRRLRARRALVRAVLWGRPLLLTADHRLPQIVASCPTFGEPLALLVQTLDHDPVRLIDVGANIGDTVALLEAAAPGRCRILCIEPDPEFAELCRANTEAMPGIELIRSFVSDVEGAVATTRHHRPGTAMTRIEGWAGADPSDPGAHERTRRLDRLAAGFVEAHGGVDVLKIDTDGFDAKVLRSARTLLGAHHPCLFFELHPGLWDEAGEDPRAAFAFLAELGYSHFVFFTNRGMLHLQCHDPAPLLLDSLVALGRARRTLDDFHFDVLTGDPVVCQAVAAASLARVAAAGKDGGHAAPGRGAGSRR
jgi:FkbM family methyltransferase